MVGGSSPSRPAFEPINEFFYVEIRVNKMIQKARRFITDVQVEMKKVVWPERDQLINSTVVVVVVSALFTLFIFFADTIVSKIINILY